MKNLTAVMAACLMLAACVSAPKPAPHVAEPEVQPVVVRAPEPVKAMTQAEIDARNLAAQLQDMKGKSVYFDFDKSVVKPEYLDIVQQQADFIKSHGSDAVTLEGNCDERGSSEYNLALGNQRATAVRKALELSGIPASPVNTVSFGEEKPRLTCHAEECWKENRRVDFVHHL